MARTSGSGTGQFSAMAADLQRAAIHFSAMATEAAAFGQSINAFREFEKQLVLTNSVAGGTIEQLKQMEQAARGFALASKSSAAEAAQSLYFLASAGFTVEESLSSMTGVLLLAQATLTPVAESADVLASNIRAFGLEASDASRVANTFAAAISASQATLPKLAFAMRQVGPVAEVASLSIERTTAALGVLFNIGLRGEQAGTALRNIIVRLANPVGEAADTLKALGIQTQQANGRMRDLQEILTEIAQKNLNEATLATIAGTEALAGMTALLESTGGSWQKLESDITGTQKSFELAQQQLNTLDGSFRLFINSVNELAISVGQAVAPALRALADIVLELAQYWNSLDESTQIYIATLASLAIGLNAAYRIAKVFGAFLGASMIIGLAKAVSGFIGLTTAIQGVTASMAALSVVTKGFLVASGIGIIALAVGAVVNELSGFSEEVSGSFGSVQINKVKKFSNEVSKEIKRLDLLFQNTTFGNIDRRNAGEVIIKGITDKVQAQQAALKELQSEIANLELEQTVGKSLGFIQNDYRFYSDVVKPLQAAIKAADGDITKTSAVVSVYQENVKDFIEKYNKSFSKQVLTDLERSADGQSKLFGEVVETVADSIEKNKSGFAFKRIVTAARDLQDDIVRAIASGQENIADVVADVAKLEGNRTALEQQRQEFAERIVDGFSVLTDKEIASISSNLSGNEDKFRALFSKESESRKAFVQFLNRSGNFNKTDVIDILKKNVDESLDFSELLSYLEKKRTDNSSRAAVSNELFAIINNITKDISAALYETQAVAYGDILAQQRALTIRTQQEFDREFDTQTKQFRDAILEKAQALSGIINLDLFANLVSGSEVRTTNEAGEVIALRLREDADAFLKERTAQLNELIDRAEVQNAQDEKLIRQFVSEGTVVLTVLQQLLKAQIDEEAANADRLLLQNQKKLRDYAASIDDALLNEASILAELRPTAFNAQLKAAEAKIVAEYDRQIADLQLEGLDLPADQRDIKVAQRKESLERERNAKIAQVRREKELEVSDFRRVVNDAQIEISNILAETTDIRTEAFDTSNFGARLRAGMARINAEYQAAVVQANNELEEFVEQYGANNVPEGFLSSRLRAAEVNREAEIKQLQESLAQQKLDYENSLRDFYAEIDTINAELNNTFTVLNPISIPVRIEQLRQEELAQVRTQFLDAVAEAERSRLELISQTSDAEEKAAINASYTKRVDLLMELKDTQELYLSSAVASYEFERQAAQENISLLERQARAANSALGGFAVSAKSMSEELSDSWYQFGEITFTGTIDTMDQAFKNFITGTEQNFGQMIANILADLAALQVKKQLVALVDAGASALSGAFGSFGGGSGGSSIPLDGSFLLQNALGNIISNGRVVQAFAKGGVFSDPTFFNMRGGKRGVFAEDGPEAIMPLVKTAQGFAVRASFAGADATLPIRRLSNGNLGVEIPAVQSEYQDKGGNPVNIPALGGGGGAATTSAGRNNQGSDSPKVVVMNVTNPDQIRDIVKSSIRADTKYIVNQVINEQDRRGMRRI